MCSQTCTAFVKSATELIPIDGTNILEVGSLDVNGSARPFVEKMNPAHYTGIDISAGPGVDEICDVCGIINKFGAETFDLVISTELLEHVRDWRLAVSNLKRVVKRGGHLVITTRSKGQMYHGYPFDFWRYEADDMKAIFSDFNILRIEKDSRSPGIFLLMQKPMDFAENDTTNINLYSIITMRRTLNISHRAALFSRLVVGPLAIIADRYFPPPIKSIIKKILSGQSHRRESI